MTILALFSAVAPGNHIHSQSVNGADSDDMFYFHFDSSFFGFSFDWIKYIWRNTLYQVFWGLKTIKEV